MRAPVIQLAASAAVGFTAALLALAVFNGRPAGAQLRPPQGGYNPINMGSGAPSVPQPLAIQGLDTNHFVVASREPRLVSQIGKEGSAQNMVLTVVTYYVVQGQRLVPIEHVKAPTGYRVITLEE